MQREPVASSMVASIGYDESTQTLEVEFRNGGIYQYYNVNAEMARQVMAATSKGQFIHTYIRNAYPYSRVG